MMLCHSTKDCGEAYSLNNIVEQWGHRTPQGRQMQEWPTYLSQVMREETRRLVQNILQGDDVILHPAPNDGLTDDWLKNLLGLVQSA